MKKRKEKTTEKGRLKVRIGGKKEREWWREEGTLKPRGQRKRPD